MLRNRLGYYFQARIEWIQCFDYLIKIRVADMQHYQRFLGEKLSAIEGISQTHTYVVIEDVKSATALNISP